MPTEMALMDMIDVNEGLKDVIGYYDELRKNLVVNKVLQLPYNSENKYMTTIYYIPEKVTTKTVMVKGFFF